MCVLSPQTWTDSRLTWTPATYGGIQDFYDTELVLWRPQIIVDNDVANLGILESDKLLIRAASTGAMTWEPPGIFETHCDVDITFYPFDTQICIVEVTSWAYTVTEVDLQAQDTEIDFMIKLRRKPSYYVNVILIPVIVTSLLCILVFLLPAESGEKVGYSLTILLTYTVMLTLVASYMPPTSKSTSVLSVYLTIILFVGVFSTYLTVMVLYCHHREEDKPIPPWLLRLTTSFMIPISCWRPSVSYDNSNSKNNGDNKNKIHPDVQSPNDEYDGFHSNERFNRTKSAVRVGDSYGVGDKRYSSSNRGISGVNHEDKSRHQGRLVNVESYDTPELKWTDIAVILDKVCFRILGLFVALLTLVVLLVLIIGGYTA
ncbi:acetylcholine receptor subunit beta [Aplysia californica]|uniref:Acetylcholine receptor subunit beta n=1 Tax=Aplysia californica TaxID=6500 RepID=A0ABM0K7L8_APLCA|nr:acetylcholine receptor subunit beta [Aplysia californica]